MGATSLATFLISLINHTVPSHVYTLMVCFIADTIFLLVQCSASHTHTLSLSLCYLVSFPFFPFDKKIHEKPLHPIIVLNKLFRFTSLSFYLEVCSGYTDFLSFAIAFCIMRTKFLKFKRD